MSSFRQIGVGATVPDAVTVGVEHDANGNVVAAVWWSSRGDVDADQARYASVPEALEAARAVLDLHGFAEIVVTLQSEDVWQPEWGELRSPGALSDEEAFELAKATEASRDA